jgi:hypothetical protein
MALYMLFFSFIWSVFGVNGHIVHVYCQPFFGDVICKYEIYHSLECCQGVGESEEHYGWFEEALVGDKCHFPLVSFSDPNVVIAPSYVKFGV